MRAVPVEPKTVQRVNIRVTEEKLRGLMLGARTHRDIEQAEAMAAILGDIHARLEEAEELKQALDGHRVAVVTPEGVRFVVPR